jgi:hypothetical protein
MSSMIDKGRFADNYSLNKSDSSKTIELCKGIFVLTIKMVTIK